MQFTSFLTVLAMAMTATALPPSERAAADLARRTNTVPTCGSSGQSPVCCTATTPILLCSIAVAGNSCSGNTKCCNVSGDPGTSLVDIDILACGLL